jgi:hypothetical protein
MLAIAAAACGRLEFTNEHRPDSRTPDGQPAVDAAFCAESPCSIVDKCGCESGQACQRTGATTDERSCITAGAATADEACSLDAECAAGFACVAVLGLEGRCQGYCAGDGDCATGLQCAELTEGVGIGICGSTCTLEGGCPVGNACKVELVVDFDSADAVAFPVCVPPAGGGVGTACKCRFDGSLPCATGTCMQVEALIFLGSVEHGVCR